jgi:3',5'-cyclic AMP phosphodiesterase CpdA
MPLGAAFLSLPLGACEAAERVPGALTFVQLTDTHVGVSDNEQRTRRVVAAINALDPPPTCVVHTGDLAEAGPPQKTAEEVLGELTVPLHVVAGNHDVGSDAEALAFIEAWGSLSSQADYHGVRLLFVHDREVRGLDYDPVVWLGRALEEAGELPVIVFHHEPPVDDLVNGVLMAGWPLRKREAWAALLVEHGVLATIAGDFHRDELHFQGGVPLYVASSVAGEFGRQASFRIYELADGRLSYRTIYLDSP